jgi:hypothetical protein
MVIIDLGVTRVSAIQLEIFYVQKSEAKLPIQIQVTNHF